MTAPFIPTSPLSYIPLWFASIHTKSPKVTVSFPGSFTCIPTFSGSTGRSFASFPSSSVKVPLKANEFQPLSPSFTPNGTTQSTYI